MVPEKPRIMTIQTIGLDFWVLQISEINANSFQPEEELALLS
jgi:hypothetical protein